MKKIHKFLPLVIIGMLTLTSLAFAETQSSTSSIKKSSCSKAWALVFSGTFQAGWDSPVDISTGTVSKLINMMGNGCDLKVNVEFENSVGQGAPPKLSFQCNTLEADNESLTCFSTIRYSQYGAIDNQRQSDRVILFMTAEEQTKITIMRHTDNSSAPVTEPFPPEYGTGQLKVFAKK